MPAQISSATKVNVTIAKPKEIAQLFSEMKQFILKTPTVLDKKSNEFIVIAKERTGRIVGYSRVKFHKTDGVIEAYLDISTRIEYKGKGIGSKILGKTNALIISEGVTVAKLTSFANGFYNKTNYRQSVGDAFEMESELKNYEANFQRQVKEMQEKRAANLNRLAKVKQKNNLSPINRIKKDQWIKKRLLRKRH